MIASDTKIVSRLDFTYSYNLLKIVRSVRLDEKISEWA